MSVFLPFLYSRVVADRRSPSGRRRQTCEGSIEARIQRVDAFDRLVELRYTPSGGTVEKARSIKLGVIGNSLYTPVNFHLNGVVVDSGREYPRQPEVISGLTTLLGDIGARKQRNGEAIVSTQAVRHPKGETIWDDHDRHRERAEALVADLVMVGTQMYSRSREPVLVAKRKVTEAKYTDHHGRIVIRDVSEDWRTRRYATYDDGSMSFPPYLSLSSVRDGAPMHEFESFEVDGSLQGIDFRFPEASSNVYEILKYVYSELAFPLSRTGDPITDRDSADRLEVVLDLLRAYEDTSLPHPDPVVAGAAIFDFIRWAQDSATMSTSAFRSTKALALCGRFQRYWEEWGQFEAVRETRFEVGMSPGAILDGDDADAFLSLGAKP